MIYDNEWDEDTAFGFWVTGVGMGSKKWVLYKTDHSVIQLVQNLPNHQFPLVSGT